MRDRQFNAQEIYSNFMAMRYRIQRVAMYVDSPLLLGSIEIWEFAEIIRREYLISN